MSLPATTVSECLAVRTTNTTAWPLTDTYRAGHSQVESKEDAVGANS